MLGLGKRIHESIAISAVFATSITLNVFWIINFFSSRFPEFREFVTLHESIGAISGFYVIGAISYFVSWGILVWLFRGRDCSHYRDQAFWFLIISIISFLVLTFPPVFTFVFLVNS